MAAYKDCIANMRAIQPMNPIKATTDCMIMSVDNDTHH